MELSGGDNNRDIHYYPVINQIQRANAAGLIFARSHVNFIGNYLKKSEGIHNLKLSFNIQGVTQF